MDLTLGNYSLVFLELITLARYLILIPRIPDHNRCVFVQLSFDLNTVIAIICRSLIDYYFQCRIQKRSIALAAEMFTTSRRFS